MKTFTKTIITSTKKQTGLDLNFLLDFNVSDYLRIGYSYDMNLTKTNNYSNGSHELLIGLDFNLRKPSFTTPRYL